MAKKIIIKIISVNITILFLFSIASPARTAPYSKKDYADLPVNIKSAHMDYDRKTNHLIGLTS